MTVKIRGQRRKQQGRKATARSAGRKTIASKGGARVYVPSPEEVERHEREIAERSPHMSQGARQFLAQMRANPDYRAVMRDLADK